MSLSSALARLVLLASVAGAAGCILLVNDNPSDLTTTCSFSARDTACGQCVLTSCASSLDACCSDLICSESTLPLIAQCPTVSLSECQEELSFAPDLASCIATSCPVCSINGASDADAGDASKGPTPTKTNCFADGDSCTCQVGNANGTVCDLGTLPGPGLCCATYGWPTATDATCECEPYSCTPETNGGTCSLSSDSSGTTTWGGTGCCSYGTFCTCDSESTDCGEATSVGQCDITSAACGSSQVQVESCSF